MDDKSITHFGITMMLVVNENGDVKIIAPNDKVIY